MDGVGIRYRSKMKVRTTNMTTRAKMSASVHSRIGPFFGFSGLLPGRCPLRSRVDAALPLRFESFVRLSVPV